jgi:hypothetical protein
VDIFLRECCNLECQGYHHKLLKDPKVDFPLPQGLRGQPKAIGPNMSQLMADVLSSKLPKDRRDNSLRL